MALRTWCWLILFLLSSTRGMCLTLEEKVGQLFFTFIYGSTLSEETKDLISRSKVGNIIYYAWANSLSNKSEVQKLSHDIQEWMGRTVGVPAIIGVDQEGGRVSRLTGEFTHFDLVRDRKKARAMAEEMRAVGITLDFAPVVDVNSNPSNPVIGGRSLSKDPDEVIRCAREVIHGFHDGGIAATLKHFPGHGNTKVDSHIGLPTIHASIEELEACELKPFSALCHESDAIMTAHIMVPALDKERCATLSPTILSELLRTKMGFRGLIISDSLVMRGVAPNQHTFEETARSVSEAAIQAFIAGCDCLLLGRLEWADFPEAKEEKTNIRLVEYVLQAFVEAVRSKRIDQARLDESVQRILLFKLSQKMGYPVY